MKNSCKPIVFVLHVLALHAPNLSAENFLAKGMPTAKLSAELSAVVESDGTLLGVTSDGSAYISVSNEQNQSILRKRSVVFNADVAIPLGQSPTILMVSYGQAGPPSQAEVEDAGFKILENYSKGSFLIVESIEGTEINAQKVVALTNVTNVEFIQPSQPLAIPDVQISEPVAVDSDAQNAVQANDPHFTRLWGLTKIAAPVAWSKRSEASEIVIAIIDTGVDYRHPDLVSNMWKNPKEIPGDGVDNDANGLVDDVHGATFLSNPRRHSGDPMDHHYHGTHCAGTVAAVGNNAIGVTGVVWSAKIMALRFLGPSGGTTVDAIRSIDYAVANGANILSNSWGGGAYNAELEEAIKRANDAGVLFVAAAGNNGRDNDSDATFPASYDVANIISVAATDILDGRAGFSNYGAIEVDIGAPGVGILSSIPGGDYNALSGTSMATPHVSGAAALIWAMEANSTHGSVKSKIFEKARPVEALRELWGQRATVKGGVLDLSWIGATAGAASLPNNEPFQIKLPAEKASELVEQFARYNTPSMPEGGILFGRINSGEKVAIGAETSGIEIISSESGEPIEVTGGAAMKKQLSKLNGAMVIIKGENREIKGVETGVREVFQVKELIEVAPK